MTCDEAIKLMDGYSDGELDPITSQTIGSICVSAVAVIAYKPWFTNSCDGNTTPYFKVPTELRERIQFSLREETNEHLVRNGVPGAQIESHKRQ